MAKKALFKGLSAIFATLVPIGAFMSVLAFDRQGDIDRALNIKAEAAEGEGDSNYFPSAYSSLEEMRKAEKDYQIRTMEEGSVLLRNKDKALPLTKTRVTLFGNASVNPAYHGGSGGPMNTGDDLKSSLEEEGFEVNATVYNKIKEQNVTRTNKDIGEVDPSIYSASDLGDYKDAAIVTICRYGGENNDMDLVDKDNVPELSLHQKEKDMLNFVKGAGFGKVIVLLNTGYAMDMGWFEEYGVDAALWIAYPGAYGFHGVAKMLKGEASPSGRLVDTYATSALSSPAMQNFGDFKFSDLPESLFHCEYLVYAENIYVGYKYYETRYEDQVRNINNAKSTKGAIFGESWDYAKEVAYPFGFGLSYASFSETLKSVNWDRSAKTLTAEVTVKNLDQSITAKHAVELYASLPYSASNAEKSAIQLIGFGKTKELAPGAEETLKITVDDYLFATYDEKATNGADSSKKGCFVFDPGDYYFAVGSDAHDALNNVLAKKSVSGLFDHEGNPVNGNANNVKVETVATLDNNSHAKSVTGEVVSNRFQDIDYNHFVEGKITYLTRNDWNTFPDAVVGLKADDDASGLIRKHMTATSSVYTKPSDAPDVSTFTYGAEVTKKFIEMKKVDFDDDEAWNAFIDQLDVQSLSLFVGEKMGNDAIVNIGYPKNSSGDGPDGLQSGGVLHPSETLAAATYNLELLEERGKFLAEDAYYNGFGMVYGGGCNLHRTPYAGRNFEYYSEDANVSYLCGRVQGKAMSQRGLIGAFKHFLANDQETNRHGVATFMTEQTLRQNQARAFEGALTDGGALGNMGAYNRIGIYPTSSHRPLMTELLRKEWGFKGISITDSSKDASSYIFTADAINAGTTCFNNDGDRSTEARILIARQKDGNIWSCLRQQAKHFFYAYSRSKVTNGLSVDTVVTSQVSWWKYVVNGIDVALISLLVLSLGAYAFTTFRKRKED